MFLTKKGLGAKLARVGPLVESPRKAKFHPTLCQNKRNLRGSRGREARGGRRGCRSTSRRRTRCRPPSRGSPRPASDSFSPKVTKAVSFSPELDFGEFKKDNAIAFGFPEHSSKIVPKPRDVSKTSLSLSLSQKPTQVFDVGKAACSSVCEPSSSATSYARIDLHPNSTKLAFISLWTPPRGRQGSRVSRKSFRDLKERPHSQNSTAKRRSPTQIEFDCAVNDQSALKRL